VGNKNIVSTAATAARIFTDIYTRNAWNGRDSYSGTGSDLYQTRIIAAAIPALARQLSVRSMLDVPCGDFHWMSRVDLDGVDYIGADIVDELIEQNRARHERPGLKFRRLDLLEDPLPTVDLILCRDCLVHLPFGDVFTALDNICRSGSEYLLTTTFPNRAENADILMGDWRPLNLEQAPFRLPPPLRTIREGCTEGGGYFVDKSLGLWRVEDVERALNRRS
jgi:SAM-dependent methyltransferase